MARFALSRGLRVWHSVIDNKNGNGAVAESSARKGVPTMLRRTSGTRSELVSGSADGERASLMPQLRLERAGDAVDPAAEKVLSALRRGERVSDDVFDANYSVRARELSRHHWTPLEVADLAIPWLTRDARRVLDVGAGVGKLCIYGALITSGVTFVGVEQRAEFVDEARRVAERLGVAERVDIHHTTIDSFDPSEFDSMYLYNPFGENLAEEPIEPRVEIGRERYSRDVRTIERWLRTAAVGTRVVTFHGFGGWVPDSFRLAECRRVGWDAIRVWDKHRAGGSLRTAYLETIPWR